MLLILIKILHIVVAVFLIIVVLFQTGKGAEMGAAFGGSSQTLFGSGGPAGFMAKLTTVAAVCFMVTSLSLAYLSSNKLNKVDLPVTQQQPATPPAQTTSPAAQPGSPGTSQQAPGGGTAAPQSK